MTTRDSRGRFARKPENDRYAVAKAIVAKLAAARARAATDAIRSATCQGTDALTAVQATIAQSLTDRGLCSPVGAEMAKLACDTWDKGPFAPFGIPAVTDTPQSIEELQACLTGRCRGASLALTDIMRADRAGKSVNYAKALARYEALSEARAMVHSVIDAQAKDKKRRGLFARLFG